HAITDHHTSRRAHHHHTPAHSISNASITTEGGRRRCRGLLLANIHHHHSPPAQLLSASITGRGKHITSAACAEHDRGREEQQHATALLNRSLPPFSRRRRRYFIKGVEIEAKLRVIGSW
ncbi:hypothetical protein Dimus_026901, partial [Dionaea muscipula]